MDPHENKLKQYIKDHGIRAEHLSFEQSCHSVADAAKASGAGPKDFVKNICLIGPGGELIVAIVKGEDKVSTTKVGAVLGVERPSPATSEQIIALTGYPPGGIPSFGYKAVFLVDTRVLDMERIYSGGGSVHSLTLLSPKNLVEASGALVASIRK